MDGPTCSAPGTQKDAYPGGFCNQTAKDETLEGTRPLLPNSLQNHRIHLVVFSLIFQVDDFTTADSAFEERLEIQSAFDRLEIV